MQVFVGHATQCIYKMFQHKLSVSQANAIFPQRFVDSQI